MAVEELLPIERLEAGDPGFVDDLRRNFNADLLAGFANDWFDDKRPTSRRLLYDYLDRPLNAFRHEGLIKRLFKRAEAAGDDQVMARLLVLFDRSIRRRLHQRVTWVSQTLETEDAVETQKSFWSGLYTAIRSWTTLNGGFQVQAKKTEEVIFQPQGTVMPRDRMDASRQVPDWAIALKLDWAGQLNRSDIRQFPELLQKLEAFRLFTVGTRNYLRRRAWRYFRTLGKTHPDRYVAAVSEALALYRDEDLADGLALIDNWGLIHILFHHCPALEALNGWTIRPGHSMAELAPAPIYESLWAEAPGAVVGLLATARSRTVRRWAVRRVEADLAAHAPTLSLEGWLKLLGHDDPDVVVLAAEVLDRLERLETVSVEGWLALAESTHPAALDAVCALIGRFVRVDQVTLAQASRLAGLRPLPLARLGFAWLQSKSLDGPGDLRTVLALVDAESDLIRPEVLHWLRESLAGSAHFEPSMILDFLDSRHLDAREAGWQWFRTEPRVLDDVETWRKLLESPHDDVRLALVTELEARERGEPSNVGRKLDPEVLRQLWASVLLNVHRGSRAKPVVVRQLVQRLEANPADAALLLPLLGVAMRSVRGPEKRSGLVAIVRLVEGRAEIETLVRANFPELQFA